MPGEMYLALGCFLAGLLAVAIGAYRIGAPARRFGRHVRRAEEAVDRALDYNEGFRRGMTAPRTGPKDYTAGEGRPFTHMPTDCPGCHTVTMGDPVWEIAPSTTDRRRLCTCPADADPTTASIVSWSSRYVIAELCLECGGRRFQLDDLLTPAAPAPESTGRYHRRCEDCGYRWRETV